MQCVVKVRDIGNFLEYIGIVEDNINYLSQYDVDVEYTNRLEIEDPDIMLLLIYHKDNKFYDQFKEPADMEELEENLDTFSDKVDNAETDLQDIINYMKSYDFDESINNVERISKMLEDVHFVGDENQNDQEKHIYYLKK